MTRPRQWKGLALLAGIVVACLVVATAIWPNPNVGGYWTSAETDLKFRFVVGEDDMGRIAGYGAWTSEGIGSLVFSITGRREGEALALRLEVDGETTVLFLGQVRRNSLRGRIIGNGKWGGGRVVVFRRTKPSAL